MPKNNRKSKTEKNKNLFKLLAQRFKEKNISSCIKILTALYAILFSKNPPKSLVEKWKDELSQPTDTKPDKEILFKEAKDRKGRVHAYYIIIRADQGKKIKTWFEYICDENLVNLNEAPNTKLVNNALRLMKQS